MDYRVPLFLKASRLWDVHFFLLGEPGNDVLSVARVSLARSSVGVSMRIWRICWADVVAMWKGVGDADTVITSFLWNGYSLYLLVICFLRAKPLTVWEERGRVFDTPRGRSQALYYRVLRRFVRSFFVLGDIHRQILEAMGVWPSQIFVANEYPGVLYSTVRPKPFVLPGLGGARRILFLGRLVPIKGVDVLLRAFLSVRQSCPEASLVIAGDGPDRQQLQRLSEDLGIEDCVLFCGEVCEVGQKSFLFAECDVLAVTSVTLAMQTEGGPLVVLEALSAGLPVVSSNAVGSSEKFVEAQGPGMVVPEGNADALANAICRVLMCPQGYRERARACFVKIPDHGNQLRVLGNATGLSCDSPT